MKMKLKFLTKADFAAVAQVWQDASDYAMLSEGQLDPIQETNDFFDSLPPGKSPADKFSLGCFLENENENLVGIVDLVRDFPAPKTWMLGLLLLIPSARGQGLGQRTLQQIEAFAKQAGAEKLRLAVLADNPAALHFWQQNGFQSPNNQANQAQQTFGQKTHQLIIMEKKFL